MESVLILNYNYYPAQYHAQGIKQLVVSVCQSVCHAKKNRNRYFKYLLNKSVS